MKWTDARQMIDGFGGSCAYFYAGFSTKLADFFFTKDGIDLSLLRIQVVPSAEDCASYFGKSGGSCVALPSAATILTGELAIAKQAVARGVRVCAAPWSPPAAMKSNHVLHQRWFPIAQVLFSMGGFTG